MKKVTAEIALSMRARHAAGGVTLVELADEYDITAKHAHKIISRGTWKHVTEEDVEAVIRDWTKRIYNQYRGTWGDEIHRTPETVTIRWDGGWVEELTARYVDDRYEYVTSTYALPSQPYEKPRPETESYGRIAGRKATRRTTQGDAT